MDEAPILGLHDSLITNQIAQKIVSWRESGHLVEVSQVDEEEVAHLLGRFIGEAATRAMTALKKTDEQVELANQLLLRLAGPESIENGPNRLLSVIKDAPGATLPDRPLTSLSEAALLTNAREDPNLAHELAAELATDHEISA
ncbi:hypothetical protein [Streptosporangium sp. NPDC049644]|uniref:hypothetical protein n=1 Tax=Streptosporangium sp. NPDC049644 TaxID=3155507 RepID=UPI003416527D